MCQTCLKCVWKISGVFSEADSLTCLMKINMIHLVDNEEMLPNAVMDYHWEKLLKTDYSVTKDWDSWRSKQFLHI